MEGEGGSKRSLWKDPSVHTGWVERHFRQKKHCLYAKGLWDSLFEKDHPKLETSPSMTQWICSQPVEEDFRKAG